MERQVTIKDIAQRAGVSTATVSNVIHGKTKRVSPATIEHVQNLIKDMGYVQAAVRAQEWEGPGTARPRLVALVVKSQKTYEDAIGADPFYGKMIGMAEQFLKRRGYYMMFYSAADMDDIFQMAMSWDVDGVITLSIRKNDCKKIARLMTCPLVSIDAYGPRTSILNVGLDDWQGGYTMTEYLLTCGYNPIYVCAGRDSGVDHLRYLGCAEAGKAAGRGADGSTKPVRIRFAPLGMNREERFKALEDLARPIKGHIKKGERPALFCLSDLYAMEALGYFASIGIKIPQEAGIAGFDDIFCSSIVGPGLTTIRQDMRRKAELAVERLAKLMEREDGLMEKRPNMQEDEAIEEVEILLPVTLVVRGSALGPVCRSPDNDSGGA